LFEEALSSKYAEKLSNDCSDSLFVKYRRDKNRKTYRNTYKNPQECLRLIDDYFLRLEVDLKLIKLTSEEIEQILTIFLSRVNNIKLTDNQLAFIKDLQDTTTRQKLKKMREKKVNKLKSFRAFLRNLKITLVYSSKQNNEFLQIRLIYNFILERKPLGDDQKIFLKMLKERTQDCKNKEYRDSEVKTNYPLDIKRLYSPAKSKFKKKSQLKNSQQKDVEKKMKKEKKPFSVEKQIKEFENWNPESERKTELKNFVVEGREILLLNVKKLKKVQDNFQKGCANCFLQEDYSVPLEYNFDEFSYNSIEKDVSEVICIRKEGPPSLEKIFLSTNEKTTENEVQEEKTNDSELGAMENTIRTNDSKDKLSKKKPKKLQNVKISKKTGGKSERNTVSRLTLPKLKSKRLLPIKKKIQKFLNKIIKGTFIVSAEEYAGKPKKDKVSKKLDFSNSGIKKLRLNGIFLLFVTFYIFSMNILSFNNNEFPKEVNFTLLIIYVLVYFLCLLYLRRNRSVTKFQLFFVIGNPLALLLVISALYVNSLIGVAYILLPVALGCSFLVHKFEQTINENKTIFYFNFSKIYHHHKLFALWISFFVIFIISCFFFFLEPQNLIVPVVLVIASTLLFTKKGEHALSASVMYKTRYSKRVQKELDIEQDFLITF